MSDQPTDFFFLCSSFHFFLFAQYVFQWDALEKITTGPYYLTLKSNGCIIFMAALTPEKLLVTSKHSVGPVKGSEISHAEMGEKWLHRHLEKAGKTPEQFAKILWDNNWTAVAEVR